MLWHKNHAIQASVITHPSDAKAWKHFNRIHPSFTGELHNVFFIYVLISNATIPYSIWPIVVCVYYLPSHMSMMRPYMFLSSVIPGPCNLETKIDVYL